jgi:hypothetical protein
MLSFSGKWDLWSDYLTKFIEEHSTDACHKDRVYDIDQSRNGYAFFEIVTEQGDPYWTKINEMIRDPKKLT